MTINLPETPEEFFSRYREFAYKPNVDIKRLVQAEELLTKALEKYPDRTVRLESMLGVIKTGLLRFNRPIKQFDMESMVTDALL